MKLRRLAIKVKGAFEGRPSRAQVEVEDWDGPLISPSALTSYRACPRKWAFGALDGVYLASTSSQSVGTELHAQLEYWLTTGRPPIGRLVDSGALTLFPLPTTPGLHCETPFAVEVANDDATRRAVLWGFRDVAYPGGVQDLKSTSSLQWAKTQDDLRGDPQAIIYAAASMLESGFDHADLRWIYVTTKGVAASQAVDVRLTRDEVEAKLGQWLDDILYMSSLREKREERALSLSANRQECSSYGGCGYLNKCGNDSTEDNGGFVSLLQRIKTKESAVTAEEEDNMKILDKVRKDLGSWKTDGMAAEAPSLPVRPAAAIAEGVNSPDAKPAEVPTPAAEAPAPTAEPKKRGRPAKLALAKAPAAAAPAAAAPAAAAPAPAPAAAAPAPAPAAAPATVAAFFAKKKILFVDCVPTALDGNFDISYVDLTFRFEHGKHLFDGINVITSKHISKEALKEACDKADLVVRSL